MATLTVADLVRAGLNDLDANANAATPAASDKWVSTGKEFLYVYNGNGSTLTVTLTGGVGLTVDGLTPTNRTVVITTLKKALIGPFPKKWYDDANGFMNIACDITASVKVLVVRFPGSPDVN